MSRFFTPLFASAVLFAVAISSVRVANADVGYDNTSGTFSGQAFALGGATGGITRMLIDDITPVATTPGDVVNFSFAVFNGNATALSVRARARFWQADGAGAGPGTYYASPGNIGYSFALFSFAPGVTVLTGTIGPGFIMPQTKFWAGLTFDNVGNLAVTDAELSLFGMGIFENPVIGSSANQYFATTAAGSFFGTSNPAGAFADFSANPVPLQANFGWRFESVSIPEPSSLFGLAFGMVLFATRNRRRSN